MNGGRWRSRRCELGPHVLDRHLRQVPLREHDQRRALRLPGDVGGGEVPLDDALATRRSARARRRPARPPRARAAPSSTRSPGAACACGAARRCRSAGTTRPPRSSTVSIASRVVPGHLRDDRPLDADQRVEERRLADVRAAEDRDADRLVADRRARLAASPRGARRPRRAGRRCCGRACAESGNGSPRPSRWNSSASASCDGSSILFASTSTGLCALRRISASSSSPGRDPRARVDDEQDEVGLPDRRRAPARRSSASSASCAAMSTPPVSIEQEPLARPLADELLAVARRPARLVDDRRAASRSGG